jgi:anti-sigma factor RsiW
MRCGDLERYLEAFLDGRLGRSRGAVLRRHLTLCAYCQARVERLRQFERDTQRRFRALEQPSSVWEGLELDLVGTSGAVGAGRFLAAPRVMAAGLEPGPDPVAQPARRTSGHPLVALVAGRRAARNGASRLAGVLLVAMALGSVYQLARASLDTGQDSEAIAAYLGLTRDASEPALRSGDREKIGQWLSERLGEPVAVPSVPEGYQLLGAGQAPFARAKDGAVIYAAAVGASDGPVLVFVRPGGGSQVTVEPPSAALSGGPGAELRELSWQADRFRYTVVGPQPEDQLRRFAP